jgi:hypothetical protein
MKKYLVLLAILISLAMVGQANAADQSRFQIGNGLIAGPCRVLGIYMTGTTAADNIGVYDTQDTGYPIVTLEFELSIASNTSSAWIDTKGARFVNGVRILCAGTTASTIRATIVYDY